jgi:hypothetical protein
MKNTAEYFLAQEWNSGIAQIHSPIECDGLWLDTTPIFNSTANFDMQALSIHIWSHSRPTSEPWIPTLHYLWICGCQHTECHQLDSKLLGADAAHPARPQLNIWIHAWSVWEGRHLNAITVMLRANLSIRGRCPPHAYRRCTAMGDKQPHLTEFWLKSVSRPYISKILTSHLSFGLHNRASASESNPQMTASAQQFCRWLATPAHFYTTLPRIGLNSQCF